ncbi:MAG: hypothetical protein COU85_02545 [Candidatus Portnoybacteria bacterium CG10_big_fil_rev_8_21_14_0_10_44_7]|uniref:Undecaprenyl-phosphate alpha-N-acetylglucosaminyl 1-phosphate transferase n=1 Tax=Candidatus Portnoybacteria bacterium CG10_big_fil_rev_8_21_14_0_10_44_7 TaxID=1974816 RepID=A0A2M8KIA6_9BACT|nr:MAG: hypothetical protein COU85_02545 [Candidatus Portnoybacteria bacterium CG10_big_fil_rev_8_21_14_0_10_44_7]
MLYFLPFLFAFTAALCLAPLLRAAIRFSKNKSLAFLHLWYRLGGVAIILSFGLAFLFNRNLVWDAPKIGLLAAGGAVLIFGLLDDYFNFKAWPQLLFHLALAVGLLFSGFRLDFLTNPLGAAFDLNQIQLAVFGHNFNLWGSLVIIGWVILIINAFNWLDGVDGLAGGVGVIGFLALFILSASSLVNQPPLGILSLMMAGALGGFLIINFPWRGPASLMLGTSGSIFVGLMLAALSILSGAKIMTTFLVLSLPIFDALWVVWSRFREGKSIFQKDQRHLHYRLQKAGWPARRILLAYYLLTAALALLAVFAQTTGKFFGLLAVLVLSAIILFSFNHR